MLTKQQRASEMKLGGTIHPRVVYKTHRICSVDFKLPVQYEPHSTRRLLGRGGGGLVIGATDKKSGDPVAIKRITNAFSGSATSMRVLREVAILHFVAHPNVTCLKGLPIPESPVFTDLYTVTDKMDTDLHVVLHTQRLSSDHVRYFLYQLLRAVQYLHAVGIVHRDLKPTNLLVNARDCSLKVCDFGLARGFEEEEEEEAAGGAAAARKMTEYVVTRHYRAPEIMLAAGHYTTAVDMWSVGCIFAEMLHPREVLFPGQSYLQMLKLMFKLLGTPTEEELPPHTSPAARQFVESLRKKQPEEAGDSDSESESPVVDSESPVVEPESPVVEAESPVEAKVGARDGLSEHFLDACPQALDLLRRLLTLDPQRRISAEQAMRHPFLAPLFRERHLHRSSSSQRFTLPLHRASTAAAAAAAAAEGTAAAVVGAGSSTANTDTDAAAAAAAPAAAHGGAPAQLLPVPVQAMCAVYELAVRFDATTAARESATPSATPGAT